MGEFGRDGSNVLVTEIGRDEAVDLFLAGKTAFLVCASIIVTKIREWNRQRAGGGEYIECEIVPVPPLESVSCSAAEQLDHETATIGARRSRSLVTVHVFFIFSRGRNKRFAEDLVAHYLAQEETGRELYEVQPRLPAQQAAQRHVEEIDADMRTYIGECRSGVVMLSSPNMREIWDAVGGAEVEVLDGRAAGGAVDRMLEKVARL